MDKPENVSDSRLPSFSQNIKRDCYGKRPISSPYHIFISVLHSEGGNILRGCQVRGPQLQTGVGSESAHLCLLHYSARTRPEIAT